MPKVVVYVRAEDTRTIEAVEKKEIEEWVREVVAYTIKKWHEKQAAEKAV